jgi:outer membrane autotransporter protein
MSVNPLLRLRARLLCSAAVGILTPLVASMPAMAQPEITYTGSVTPTPPPGTTDWDFSSSQTLVVGFQTAGSLSITGGAKGTGDTVHVGDQGLFGSADLLVDGTGSSLQIADLRIGNENNSTGTVTISNGGEINLNSVDPFSVTVGAYSNTTADLIVSGAGSSLTANQRIIIGGDGTGNLTIADGGQVTGYQLYLGNGTSGTGHVTISGQGSAWNGQHGIWVGQFGNGSLDLYDGGAINDNSLEIAYKAGTTGIVNVGGAAGAPARAGGILNVGTIEFNRDGGGSTGILNFNTTDTVAVHADIKGTGTINQIAGTTVITGNGDGFTGTTNITGGVLQLGDGGTSGSLAGAISTGTDAAHAGTLAFNRADDVSVSNLVSGAGAVRQMGTGTTTLVQDNNYAGDTWITAGTLSVTSDAKLGLATGAVTLDGGTLQVTGNAFTSTSRAISLGDHGGGFDIAEASNTFTVSQSLSGSGQLWKRGQGMLVLTGDNSFAGGLHVEAGTAKAGIVDHAFGSGILNVDAGATADLDVFNTSTGGLAGGGTVALNAATLTLAQDVNTVFSGTINGSGGLIKNGSGALTLSGSNSYSGPTALNDGMLKQGAAGALSSASAYQVAQTGTLDLGGFSTNIASLDNQGNVNFAGTGGATLHVTGNYSGNGAITITSVLGGDTSKTDMLAVDGDTAGTTKLNVINQDGSGALTVNGIKVVDVGGNSNGSFALGNGYTTKDGQQAIVGGAFAYTLQQGGAQGGTQGVNDGNWYLVSHASDPDKPVDPTCQDTNSCPPPPSPRYSAGAPVYEGYVQNMLALNKLPSLQQRVGNRYFAGASLRGSEDGGRAEGASFDARGVWARVEGAHNRLEPSTSTARMKQDINTLEMQTGVDGQFYENDQGRLIAGITAQYGHAKGDVSSQHGDGTITTDAWSLGATATWYGNDGFYLDGQSQVTWFDNDLDSSTANQSLANGRKATGYAVSLETGKQIALGGNWSLTPQAQLSWSSISANSFRDAWNARVAVDDGDSLIGRLGLAAQYATAWKDDQGRFSQASVYGIANLYQAFFGGTTVNLSGVDFDTDNDRTWGGIGLGGSYAWADNKYALYGEGSVNTGLTHFADSYSLKANAGFKVRW